MSLRCPCCNALIDVTLTIAEDRIVEEHEDEILSSAQAAALLGLKPSALKARRLRRDGSAPAHLKGGRPKYRRRDVLAFIEQQKRSRR
jgi:hypothetical protein